MPHNSLVADTGVAQVYRKDGKMHFTVAGASRDYSQEEYDEKDVNTDYYLFQTNEVRNHPQATPMYLWRDWVS